MGRLTTAAAILLCLGLGCAAGPDELHDEGETGGKADDAGDDDGVYGFATIPPQMVLADTFYSYDVRTVIGRCDTDRVEWTYEAGPSGSALTLDDGMQSLAIGDSLEIEDGSDAREAAKLTWDLAGLPAGEHELSVSWRAWLDCGIGDDGDWGPTVTQSWSVLVRENHWYSGDLHVHTLHSERDELSGSAHDYYRRMKNEVPDDAGNDFASRRYRSLRGQLQWLVFSDHTNNEHEECGAHFAEWCEPDAALEKATGREVVQQITESDDEVLLVIGSEISNKFDGHFGFLPANPFPGHPRYAPGFFQRPTDYEVEAGFGVGVFRERWVDEAATNQEQLDLIHAMNGLAIVNHEAGPAPWVSYDWTSLDFDGIEVWNGGLRHDQFDDDALHGRLDLNEVAEDDELTVRIEEDEVVESWIGMIKHGRWPMAAVGGSDVHDFREVVCFDGPCDPTNAELAVPTTSVWAENFVWTDGENGVFDGIEAGRTVVHDFSNFIDFRVIHEGQEYMVGDTIAGYRPGDVLHLRAFGRTANYVDGDNRVLLMLGTAIDPEDRAVDVVYNSEDTAHFVEEIHEADHMRYIRPDSNFDRQWELQLSPSDFGPDGGYVLWSQFIPWHNPLFLQGNGQDMALTGAIRIQLD